MMSSLVLWVREEHCEPVPLEVPEATALRGNVHDLKLLIRQAGEVLDSKAQLGRVSLTRVRGEEEHRLAPSDRIGDVLSDGDHVHVRLIRNQAPSASIAHTATSTSTSTTAAPTSSELTSAQIRELTLYHEGERILLPSTLVLTPNAQLMVSINLDALMSMSRPEKYRIREGSFSNYLYLYQELGFSRTSITSFYSTSGLVTGTLPSTLNPGRYSLILMASDGTTPIAQSEYLFVKPARSTVAQGGTAGSLKTLCLSALAQRIIEEDYETDEPLDLSMMPTDMAGELLTEVQQHGMVSCDILRKFFGPNLRQMSLEMADVLTLELFADLAKCPNLRVLRFGPLGLSDIVKNLDCIEELAATLASMTALEELYIKSPCIPPLVLHCLEQVAPQLKALTLVCEGGLPMKAFESLASKLSGLTSLHIEGLFLNSPKVLQQLFDRCSTLKSLNMTRVVGLSPACFKDIQQRFPKLASLDIVSSGPLSIKALEHIAACKKLVRLAISSCFEKTPAITRLLLAKPWPKLEELHAANTIPAGDIERVEEAYAHLGKGLLLAPRRIVLSQKRFHIGEQITGHVEYVIPKTDTTTEWIAAFQAGADNGTYGARWVYLNLVEGRYPFTVPMDGLTAGPCELRIFGSDATPNASAVFTALPARAAQEVAGAAPDEVLEDDVVE